ncbi:MAG: dihydrofolate reductase [Chrysothrix sp. TS-e1954]|nr:MAG: dihydrofolate reductase [Chrysothrix sp. TS-e1954]
MPPQPQPQASDPSSPKPNDNQDDADRDETMPNPPTKELTLIVAATRTLGIGQNGQLPWPKLKAELGFFSRVTSWVPPSLSPSPSPSPSASALDSNPNPTTAINALIMGRKTYTSIPPSLRPLKNRYNVVISSTLPSPPTPNLSIVPNLSTALSTLSHPDHQPRIARVFVIGGARVYGDALGLGEVKRVLLTKIKEPEFECDRFFPVDLEGGVGWVRRGKGEWGEWTGEGRRGKGVGGVQTEMREGGVEWEFCMFEREEAGVGSVQTRVGTAKV